MTFPAVLAEADQSRHEDRRLEIHPEVESLCSARGSCTVMNPKKPSSTIIWLRKPSWGHRGHTHFSLRRCRHLRSQRSHVFLLRCRHHRHHRSRRPDGGGDRCGVKAGIRGGGGSPGDGLARLSWQAKSLVDRRDLSWSLRVSALLHGGVGIPRIRDLPSGIQASALWWAIFEG